MGSWNGEKLGLKVELKDERLAQQFLHCIGVDTNDYIVEEVDSLCSGFSPSIEGKVKGKLLGIMPILKERFSQYLEQFFGEYAEDDEGEYEDDDEYGDEESDNEDDIDEQPNYDLTLDDLFELANKLFTSAFLYFAHEDGNNTSDDYYRHEEIYSPSTGYCTIKDCFYSYGEGINVDTDDPKEEGTETKTVKIASRELNGEVIDWLIQKAKAYGYDDLAHKLNTCK